MFYDKARIFVRSGDGGDGMIGFRREKFVPFGGPDGGDGGHGGDVVFVVNPKLNNLNRYHRQVHFRAENANHGGKSRKTGASGSVLRLEVPPGTLIRLVDPNGDEEEEGGQLLADLTRPGQEFTAAVGGRGGRGNARFANSVQQAPRVAERGEPGQEMWLELELKLIADVGIAGVPNAGKSTLLSVISAARPKIASYPFTTLTPNLGVVQLDDDDAFVVADIPGLIEGASAGIGLGHDFLRHVERTRVLVHLLDGAAESPVEDFAMINQELAEYDRHLAEKPQLVVLNKMDLPDAQAWEPIVEEIIENKGFEFMSISAVTGQNVREMLYRVKQLLDETPLPAEIEEIPVITPEADDMAFSFERSGDEWWVYGAYIERVADMTYWEFDATVMRFQRLLERSGITAALEDAGIEPGHTVHIGEHTLEWGE